MIGLETIIESTKELNRATNNSWSCFGKIKASRPIVAINLWSSTMKWLINVRFSIGENKFILL